MAMDGAGGRQQKPIQPQINQKLGPGAQAGFKKGARLHSALVLRPALVAGLYFW